MAEALFEDEETCLAPEGSGKEPFNAHFYLPGHSKLIIASVNKYIP